MTAALRRIKKDETEEDGVSCRNREIKRSRLDVEKYTKKFDQKKGEKRSNTDSFREIKKQSDTV